MFDREKIETILSRRFPGAASHQMAAAPTPSWVSATNGKRSSTRIRTWGTTIQPTADTSALWCGNSIEEPGFGFSDDAKRNGGGDDLPSSLLVGGFSLGGPGFE